MSNLKLLIPVDFSNNLTSIYEWIEKLSAQTKLEVTLLHVIETPVVPSDYLQPVNYLSEFYANYHKTQQERLDRLSEEIYFKNTVLRTKIADNPGLEVSHSIADYASFMNPDLVILTSKHRSGLNKVLAGSQLVRTIRNCRYPMLVLSPGQTPNIRRVLFATDFSESSAEYFRKAENIASKLNFALECFYINTSRNFISQRDYTKLRSEFIAKIGVSEAAEIAQYNADNVGPGLIQCADDNISDAIVLVSHPRHGIEGLFNPSTTNGLSIILPIHC